MFWKALAETGRGLKPRLATSVLGDLSLRLVCRSEARIETRRTSYSQSLAGVPPRLKRRGRGLKQVKGLGSARPRCRLVCRDGARIETPGGTVDGLFETAASSAKWGRGLKHLTHRNQLAALAAASSVETGRGLKPTFREHAPNARWVASSAETGRGLKHFTG